MGTIIQGDNLTALRKMASGSVDLIYIDPPFNTGKMQTRPRLKTVRDQTNGDRTGFSGKRYRTIKIGSSSYADTFDDYIGFLRPRMVEAHRVLAEHGSFFFHIDPREVH